MQLTPKFDVHRKIIECYFPDLKEHAAIYSDLHQYPELPCQEQRTASVIVSRLETLGFSVQRHIGGHGVVGLLTNGPGANILLRSELDALPISEATGLPYASKAKQVDADGMTKGVMHACAHDIHMACLLGVAELLKSASSLWSGTLIILFQPNEERLLGAKAMIEDGLFDKIPMPIRAGLRAFGFAGCAGLRAHGATPQLAIDPSILAASILTRVQTVVGREIDPKDSVFVGCGMIRAGTDASTIPDFADFTLDSIQRGYTGDAAGYCCRWFVLLALPPGQEAIPYVYWNFGVTDPEIWEKANREGKLWDLPPTHSATYAPVIEPTLRTGIEAMTLSALTFLNVNSSET
ncbi:hypothetical protein N7488_004484 [Penicillium malachiteum]|nr:hypothetical protein N7488_004484 [Penicillium malachiteum]